MKSRSRFMTGAIASFAALVAPGRLAAQSPSPTLKTLYSFTSQAVATPYSTLAISGSGVLYGPALHVGSSGYGAVFELTPPGPAGGAWTESVLYQFQGRGKGDGSNPQAGLVIGKG